MQVFVRLLDGKLATLNTGRHASGSSLVRLAAARAGVAPTAIELAVNGRRCITLETTDSLLSLGVKPECTLYCSALRRAGPAPVGGARADDSAQAPRSRIAVDLFTAWAAIHSTPSAAGMSLSALGLADLARPGGALELFATARRSTSASFAGEERGSSATGDSLFQTDSEGWDPLDIDSSAPGAHADQVTIRVSELGRSDLGSALRVVCNSSAVPDAAFAGLLARLRAVSGFPPACLTLARLREGRPLTEAYRCALATGLWAAARALGIRTGLERPRLVLWHLAGMPSRCALPASEGVSSSPGNGTEGDAGGFVEASLDSDDTAAASSRLVSDPCACLLVPPAQSDGGSAYGEVALTCAADPSKRLEDPVRVTLRSPGGGLPIGVTEEQAAFFDGKVFSRARALSLAQGGSDHDADSAWAVVSPAMLLGDPARRLLLAVTPATEGDELVWQPRALTASQCAAALALKTATCDATAAASGAGGPPSAEGEPLPTFADIPQDKRLQAVRSAVAGGAHRPALTAGAEEEWSGPAWFCLAFGVDFALAATALRCANEELAAAAETGLYGSAIAGTFRLRAVPPEQLATAPTPCITFTERGHFGVCIGVPSGSSRSMKMFDPLTGKLSSFEHAALGSTVKGFPSVVAEMRRAKAGGAAAIKRVEEICAVLLDGSNSMNSRGFPEEADPFEESDKRKDRARAGGLLDAAAARFKEFQGRLTREASAGSDARLTSLQRSQIRVRAAVMALQEAEAHAAALVEEGGPQALQGRRTECGMEVPEARSQSEEARARDAAFDESARARLASHPSLGVLRFAFSKAAEAAGTRYSVSMGLFLMNALPYALMDQRERMTMRVKALGRYASSVARWAAAAIVCLASDPDGCLELSEEAPSPSAGGSESANGPSGGAGAQGKRNDSTAPDGQPEAAAAAADAPSRAADAAAESEGAAAGPAAKDEGKPTAKAVLAATVTELSEGLPAPAKELLIARARDAELVSAYIDCKEHVGEGAPDSLRCPLTSELMTLPVRWADGQVYHRPSLESMLEMVRMNRRFGGGNEAVRSPVTGLAIDNGDVRTMAPDPGTLAKLRKFLEANPLGFHRKTPAAEHCEPHPEDPLGDTAVVRLEDSGDSPASVLPERDGCARVAMDLGRFGMFAAYIDPETTAEHLLVRACSAAGLDPREAQGKKLLNFCDGFRAFNFGDKLPAAQAAFDNSTFRVAGVFRTSSDVSRAARVMGIRTWVDGGSQASATVSWFPSGLSVLDVKMLSWVESSFSRRTAPWMVSFWCNFRSSGDGWRSGTLLEEDASLTRYALKLSFLEQPAGSFADQDEEGCDWGPDHGTPDAPHGVIVPARHHTPHDAPDRVSRIITVKELFHAFVNRLIAYDEPIELSLSVFGSKVDDCCDFTPLFEDFRQTVSRVTPDGDTALLDAIGTAVQRLRARQEAEHPGARLRILVLSDGKDTSSVTWNALSTAKELQRHDVTMDAVVIGDEVSDDLFTLCKCTGGYFFNPESLEESQRLVELELFLSTLQREDKKALPLVTSRAALRAFRDRYHYPVDSCLDGRLPAMRPHPEMSGAAADLTAASSLAGIAAEAAEAASRASGEERGAAALPAATRAAMERARAAGAAVDDAEAAAAVARIAGVALSGGKMMQRLRRIRRELLSLRDDPHPLVEVFPGRENPGFWRLLVRGPEGSPYEGGTWLAYMDLPAEFPRLPPVVRFQTPIKHVNVSPYGKVCHSVLATGWTATTPLRRVIDCMYGMLLTPETDSPVDTVLAMQYNKEAGAYEMHVKAHTVEFATGTTPEEWRAQLLATASSPAPASPAGGPAGGDA